jgi:gliding motility-associated-like protein
VFGLVVTDVSGCKDTAYTTVNVFPPPPIDVSGTHVIYFGESVELFVSGGASYQWSPDSTLELAGTDHPIATPAYSTTYTVLITTAEGCLYSREVPVIVDRTSIVFVPNAFSPNGDGMNDKLFLIVRGVFTLKSFSIFNRWGESVFATNDVDQGWNGLHRQEPAPVGVYVYQVIGSDINGRTILKSGNITLVR